MFNRLLARMASMLRAHMALVGDISHDVRRFPTQLRLRVESISDDEERHKAHPDIEDMILMLDNALLLADEGSGIPVDQREEMLEPFNRLEFSRNRGTDGADLG